MDNKKSMYNTSVQEVLDKIAKARSEADIQKILRESSDPAIDMHNVNRDTLGHLIEQRYGADDVRTTDGLNKFLQKIKGEDYKNIDDIRKILYKEAQPLDASYHKAAFGSGVFYPNPTLEKPIRIGDTDYDGSYSNGAIKTIAGHEMAHAYDTPAMQLKRMKHAVDPKQYEELVKRIGDLGEGGEKFLEHSNNIQERYIAPMANMLNPEKAALLKELIMEEPPSAQREEHLRMLNKYESVMDKDLGRTQGKQMMEQFMGVDANKIPTLKAESINFDPDREYVKSVLVKHFPEGEAEAIRSSAHHGIRTDIKGDRGHYEARNIDRLSKGKGLLGVLGQPIAIAAQIVPSIVDVKKGNPNTAAARLVNGLAPFGSEQLQKRLMDDAEIEDKYPHLRDSTYRRTLENIGKRRMEAGKSPVVEDHEGNQIDTSATENNDFLNRIKALQREKSQA